MAKNEATICNKALARLGIKVYIDDLETDQTEEAETANVFYEDVRDACLALHEWPFAMRRVTLAQDGGEAKRDGWLYVFKYPSDCLVARSICPVATVNDPTYDDLYGRQSSSLMNAYRRSIRSDQRIPYAIEAAMVPDSDGKVILCDLPAPVLFYTSRITDTAQFPPLFTSALAWKLAEEMALPLTQDRNKMLLAREEFKTTVQEALAVALNEQQEDPEPTTESIAVRY